MNGLAGGTHVKVPFLLSCPQALHSALLRRCGRQIEGDSPAQGDRLDSKMLGTAVRSTYITQSDLLPRVRVCETESYKQKTVFQEGRKTVFQFSHQR